MQSDTSADDNQQPAFSEQEFIEEVLGTAIQIIREKEEPTRARLNAIRFIIDQFESKFITTFIDILNDETEDPEIRSASALALGKIGGDTALKILLQHVQSDNLTVKNYTLQALGLLGRPEGIPFLIEALKDRDNDVFASAAESLGSIGKPAVPYLIGLLQNSENEARDDARCIAAWQLGQLQYADAVPALIKTIEEESPPDKNHELSALSIWALGEIGQSSKEVMDVLKKARSSDDPALFERANMAIHKITRHLN